MSAVPQNRMEERHRRLVPGSDLPRWRAAKIAGGAVRSVVEDSEELDNFFHVVIGRQRGC